MTSTISACVYTHEHTHTYTHTHRNMYSHTHVNMYSHTQSSDWAPLKMAMGYISPEALDGLAMESPLGWFS